MRYDYKSSVRIYMLLLILALIKVDSAQAVDWSTTDDFPYKLCWAAELAIIPTGAATLAVGIYLDETMDAPTEAEILALDSADVSSFDRSATHNFYELADDMSDVALILTGASPALLTLPEMWDLKKRWMNIVTLAVMYGETSMWTLGATELTKALVKRPRPYMYNEKVSMETKLEASYTSFFSGHTSFAFCGAVFVSTVFSDIYPDSPWRFAVWGGSVAAAGLTGYLRYVAGRHFPTDILVGAAVGSVFGFIVPFLHRKKLWSKKEVKAAIVPAASRHRARLDIIWLF
jgi:membrane-associated phospholipid phosphatase